MKQIISIEPNNNRITKDTIKTIEIRGQDTHTDRVDFRVYGSKYSDGNSSAIATIWAYVNALIEVACTYDLVNVKILYADGDGKIAKIDIFQCDGCVSVESSTPDVRIDMIPGV